MNRVLLLFFSLLLIIGQSCSSNKTAKPMPESAKAYVYAYSNGVVSRIAPLKIQFAGIVVTEEEVGTEAARGLVEMSPSAAGKWTWVDRQTLRFDPAPAMEFATAYIVTVALEDLFDNVPEEARQFEFSVKTRDPFVSLELDGLTTPDPSVRESQVLKGQILTSDYVADEEVPELLSVAQSNEALNLVWSHNAEGTVHYFTAPGVKRGEATSEITLSWNGAAISAMQKGNEKVEVPKIGDFKVTKAVPYGGGEAKVDIHFSDPIKEDQDFSGLVNISNSTNEFRYVAKGHVLTLYLNEPLAGNQQLSVYTGIQNRYRETMPRSSVWEVTFTATEPQVRLVGQGNILPASAKLVFPFEAIGLNAVEVEIFKIHSSNILQFLQDNNLDGQYDLNKVGKVILRQEVALKNLKPTGNHAQWERYALDLRQFFEMDAKSFYQVRIGFRRDQSRYNCSNQNFTFQERYNRNNDASILNNWYGLEGYYQEYRWDQRDDPCYPAYYNSDRFIVRNVMTSNLGLIVKEGQNQSYSVAVTNLQTAGPVAEATVHFYDYQQQLLGTLTTNAKGLGAKELSEDAFFAVAETTADQAYVRLDDGSALSTSRFDVGGTVLQEGLKGYLYAERGVWRPGDSVFLNFVLEDEKGLLPPAYPVTFELRDAQGQMVEKREGIVPEGEIYPVFFRTSPDDITGVWQASISAGDAVFRKNLRIETIKPNRIKVALTGAEDPIRMSSGVSRMNLEAAWLHGAPAANLKANVEASFQLDRSGFEAFPDYSFYDRNQGNLLSQNQVVFDAPLDDKGKATVEVRMPNANTAAGPLHMRLRTRVYEQGGNFSTESRSFEVFPFDYYAGLRMPEDRYGSPRVLIGEDATIQLASANYQGKVAAGRKLKTELFRVEWRWWWDDEDARGARYARDRNLRSLSSETVTTDASGKANWKVKVDDWGRYLIRVCDEESGHCAAGYVYAGSPWYNEDTFSEEASMLTFRTDKTAYEVGDEVSVTFPAGSAGRALLSLENGEGVIEERWLDTQAGDNVVSFKATADMAPTVYAFLTVLQPYDQDANDLPMRAYGVIPIKVEDPATILEPKILMAEELKPEDFFTVEVSETKGQAMTYTLAVVDEGLLSLTNFKTPNPHETFFAREALGVKTWDLYRYVLSRTNVELNHVLTIGGDGDLAGGKKEDRANRFDPVVLHLGPFELGKGQKVKHRLRMPNYVGAVRAMVVAAKPHAYGSAEKSVPVRKPLMVLATLPRVLGIGEQLELPVNVFAMKEKLGNIKVRLEESSGLVNIATASKQVNFSTTGDQLIRFPISVGNGTGVAKFTVIAEGGGERTTQEIEIDIRNPNPMQSLATPFVLAKGEEKTLDYVPFGSEGTRTGTLEMTNLPPLDLERRLKYLLRYPYGCLEQTTSAAFPQLHLATFMELNDEQRDKVRTNIGVALDRLRQFQRSDGAFSYWPNRGEISSWATSYVGHFLLAAQAAGYTIPSGVLQNWQDYQQGAARAWDGRVADFGLVSRRSYELDQAYRLYTLALAGKPELGAMNRLRERNALSGTSRWRLAAAYALAGQGSAAKDLVRSLTTEVSNYREMDFTYGSGLRDQAMILETLILLEDQSSADLVAQQIAKQMNSQRWLSTQEVAYCLLSFSKYIGENDELSKTYTFTMKQGAANAIDVGADHPYIQINLKDRTNPILVKNTSTQKLFGSIVRQGQPLPEEEQPISRQLQINIVYRDAAGTLLDVSRMEQGTDFIAEVTVSHPNSLNYGYRQLALEQVFPAGWEITNTRFEEINTNPESGYNYRDFRDDRVNTFFNLGRNENKTFRVYLSATYSGRFYLPASTCGAMYDNDIFASSSGYWVEVVTPAIE
ncbi:MAG: alpha-2-macroglobulin family protein [Lewinella sp.]|uniref:alpha-2-macroglobulin family protein n=1 Tax=Lewinella sp. TaxID=2004506 RepID=UPI003D6B76B3